jgi:hypothetical protein
MKIPKPRLDLIKEYELAPDSALFNQDVVAAIRDCSLATIERDRWAGTGVPFIKTGRLVRYRKTDIRDWLKQHVAFQSTTQMQAALQTNSQMINKGEARC